MEGCRRGGVADRGALLRGATSRRAVVVVCAANVEERMWRSKGGMDWPQSEDGRVRLFQLFQRRHGEKESKTCFFASREIYRALITDE